jgi:hypothetical protein
MNRGASISRKRALISTTARATVSIRGRQTVAVERRFNGWYDVTITSSRDDLFVRQFAGHAETHQSSISDPAFGRCSHRGTT